MIVPGVPDAILKSSYTYYCFDNLYQKVNKLLYGIKVNMFNIFKF